MIHVNEPIFIIFVLWMHVSFFLKHLFGLKREPFIYSIYNKIAFEIEHNSFVYRLLERPFGKQIANKNCIALETFPSRDSLLLSIYLFIDDARNAWWWCIHRQFYVFFCETNQLWNCLSFVVSHSDARWWIDDCLMLSRMYNF